MYLGEPGEQFVLKNEKAFHQLAFHSAEPVDRSLYFPKKRARDQQARQAYFRMLEDTPLQGAVFMNTLLTENWKNDDPRLR